VEEGSWVGELYKIFFDLFFLFLKFGGVYLKKFELISPKIFRVDRIPPIPPSARLYKNRKRKACPIVNAKRYTSGDDFKFFASVWRQLFSYNVCVYMTFYRSVLAKSKWAKPEATERERSIYALLNEGSSVHHYFINLFYQIPGINRYFTFSAYSL
jgi:hypothetical protein